MSNITTPLHSVVRNNNVDATQGSEAQSCSAKLCNLISRICSLFSSLCSRLSSRTEIGPSESSPLCIAGTVSVRGTCPASLAFQPGRSESAAKPTYRDYEEQVSTRLVNLKNNLSSMQYNELPTRVLSELQAIRQLINTAASTQMIVLEGGERPFLKELVQITNQFEKNVKDLNKLGEKYLLMEKSHRKLGKVLCDEADIVGCCGGGIVKCAQELVEKYQEYADLPESDKAFADKQATKNVWKSGSHRYEKFTEKLKNYLPFICQEYGMTERGIEHSIWVKSGARY